MKYINIVWIDDDEDRKKHTIALKRHYYKDKYDNNEYKVQECEFFRYDKDTSLKALMQYINRGNYDLVIIDHFLKGINELPKTGRTLSGHIKDSGFTAPIVCVTAADNIKRFPSDLFDEYEDLIIEDDIGDNFNKIFSLVVGFKNIFKSTNINKNDVLRLLKAPTLDSEILKQVMPVLSKDSSNIIARKIYRWYRDNLLALPGFMFDQDWTANLIGVNQKGFLKIMSKFKEAEYSGVFADKNNKRWWRSKIIEIIYRNTYNKDEQQPWKAGHGIKGISLKDRAICASCRKLFPETMGYDDETKKKRFIPLHFHCSEPVVNEKKQLYYESIRQMN